MDLMKYMRGQAAMEYLMTYGWALLVIVIAIAILLIINPFSPPQGCRFDQVGFTCSNPSIKPTSELYLRLQNGQNTGIYVCDVLCTTSKDLPTAPTTCAGSSPLVARDGEYETTAGGRTEFCYNDKTGTVKLNPSSGSAVTAKLYLFYKTEEDGLTSSYPVRTSVATLTTKVS